MLKQDVELADKEGFYFGAKLVRGAYMEQERELALKMNYEDPINESYAATTRMYETSLSYCLEQIKARPENGLNIMVASHNEGTVRFALEKWICFLPNSQLKKIAASNFAHVNRMEELGIKPQDNNVHFGQLLGMCDYISFYLGGSGYSAFKYVPYGPLDEVMPYLSR